MIKHIVFDLDGTLTDSSSTIYKTAIATFEQLGMSVSFPKIELDKRIGAHFKEIFDDFDIHVEDLEQYINLYKKIYFDFIDDTFLYPDVEEVLVRLRKDNYKISLLTTKAQDQAEKILQHFNLSHLFDEVMGRRAGIKHKPSPEPLLLICKNQNAITNETLMVGDTEFDIICGRDAGAKTCAVTYGYRTKSRLIDEKPDFIIDSISSLNGILLNHNF